MVIFWMAFWLYELIMSSNGAGHLTEGIRNFGAAAEGFVAGYRSFNEGVLDDGYAEADADPDEAAYGDGRELPEDTALPGSPGEAGDAAPYGRQEDQAGSGDAVAGQEGDSLSGGASADGSDDASTDGVASGASDDAGADETGSMEEEVPEEEFVPMPYYFTADESYFDDALFIGDSRMMGIYDYCGFEGATFLCDNGYSIANYVAGRGVKCQNTGTRTTPGEIMSENHYGKVYVMIGTNDCPAHSPDKFREGYADLMELIRREQPDAIIFNVANLNMSAKGENENRSRGFDNTIMNSLNAAVSEFADGETSFFLNFNPLFTDENGYLWDKYSFDGFHVYAAQYQEMGDYLAEHAVAYTTP